MQAGPHIAASPPRKGAGKSIPRWGPPQEDQEPPEGRRGAARLSPLSGPEDRPWQHCFPRGKAGWGWDARWDSASASSLVLPVGHWRDSGRCDFSVLQLQMIIQEVSAWLCGPPPPRSGLPRGRAPPGAPVAARPLGVGCACGCVVGFVGGGHGGAPSSGPGINIR